MAPGKVVNEPKVPFASGFISWPALHNSRAEYNSPSLLSHEPKLDHIWKRERYTFLFSNCWKIVKWVTCGLLIVLLYLCHYLIKPNQTINSAQINNMGEELQQAEVTFKERLETIAVSAKDDTERKEFTKEIDGIVKLFSRFLKNRKRVIDWGKIKPPPADMVVNYGNIPTCPEDRMQELGKKLVVLKLNGGLGTTMGCTGPKSAIEVRNDLTFLDLTVQQIKVCERKYCTQKCHLFLIIILIGIKRHSQD